KKDPAGADAYLAKAEAKLTEALNKGPDEAMLYSRLADLSSRANKPEEARKIVERLAAGGQCKERDEPYLMLAGFYRTHGTEYQARAEQALLQAVAKSKNDNEVKKSLVDFYVETNRLDDAIKLLSNIAETTKSAMLRNRLIELEISAGQHMEA